MIKLLSEYSPEQEYDLCIIGSGPAGLTIAHELADSGQTICVLESGSARLDKNHDGLKKVTSLGEILIKDNSRERALGGTSNTWTGLSAPLDPIDLARWPISYNELCTYYKKLEPYGFPPFSDFFTKNNSSPETKLLESSETLEEKIFIASVPPTNFGKKFEGLFQKPTLDLYLNATVTKILTNNEQTRAIGVRASNSVQEQITIKAKKFVICAGGLESARLLLISDGLGNRNDQVGRYLMNHPKGNAGVFTLYDNQKISTISSLAKIHTSIHPGIRIQEHIQKQFGLLNSYFRLEPKLSRNIFLRLARQFCYQPTAKTFILRNFMDMEPRPQSRIYLGKEKDCYGNALPIVDVSLSTLDKNSLTQLHAFFKKEVEGKKLGTFKSNLENSSPWPITLDASHHLGGTIMGKDSRMSVVDRNLKVHSVDNLYICSGSVFPTAGCANPTYTICALAVRLAEHLRVH